MNRYLEKIASWEEKEAIEKVAFIPLILGAARIGMSLLGSAAARTAISGAVRGGANLAMRGFGAARTGVTTAAKSFQTPTAVTSRFTQGMGRNMTRMEGAKVNMAYNAGRAKTGVQNYAATTGKMGMAQHAGTGYLVSNAMKGSGAKATQVASQGAARAAQTSMPRATSGASGFGPAPYSQPGGAGWNMNRGGNSF